MLWGLLASQQFLFPSVIEWVYSCQGALKGRQLVLLVRPLQQPIRSTSESPHPIEEEINVTPGYVGCLRGSHFPMARQFYLFICQMVAAAFAILFLLIHTHLRKSPAVPEMENHLLWHQFERREKILSGRENYISTVGMKRQV